MRLLIPVLRGDDPLGFLASLGLVGLSEQGALPPLRLAWEGRLAPAAAVDTELPDRWALADALRMAFAVLRERGEAVPGVRPDFPLRRDGGGKDPMRARRDVVGAWYEEADERWHEGDPWFARWLIALAAQAAVKSEQRGDVELTPFYAPTGQMALRGSIFDKTVEAVEKADGPGDVVERWRRVSYDGANFDDRAKRDAGVTTTGEPANQGAPSATWLAAMAIRLFPLTDDGRTAAAVGWQRVRMYEGFTARSLVWPTWGEPLDAPAVRALLAHPALVLEQASGGVRLADPSELPGLGVTAVFGSSRRTLSQGDGPLGPARRMWSAIA